MAQHYLSPLFEPASIAVFGASPRAGSVGGRVFANLVDGGFQGPLIAINPKHKTVRRRKCHPSLAASRQRPDLAVIATPADTVPAILEECGRAGVPAAIVMSAGFSETGGAGKRLQKKALAAARRGGVRILGPNCLGLMRPEFALNATFGRNQARPGDLALVSQSGALCTAILDWAEPQGIGFSTVVSLGDAADIDFGELLDFLALDRLTRSILLYVEGVQDARSLLSGLRVAARLKPTIVMKAGRFEAGSTAAVSHTGALVGADDVFDAALARAGVVRVPTIEELFAAARMLASEQRVGGRRLAIVSNAGGPGVIAADSASEHHVELAELSRETIARLDPQLPAHWSRRNPVDILGDADTRRYEAAIDACLTDDAADAVLAILTPQAMTEPVEAARAVVEARSRSTKPVVASWMGEAAVDAARDLFAERGVPDFPTPESAVAAFSHLANHHRNQQLLLQVPGPLTSRTAPDLAKARRIIDKACAQGRTQLTLSESKGILEAFHVPVNPTIEAKSAPAAVAAAEKLGYPIVLKISSPDLPHKSDVGGVELNLRDAYQVEGAYHALRRRVRKRAPDAVIHGITVEPMYEARGGRELMVGVLNDKVFGPVISFGAGGVAVEVYQDRAIALPPLNEVLIDDMISKTRVARLIGSFRHLPPVDTHALVEVLLRISEMVCELPQVTEMDINPLVADENGVIAVDARFTVHPVPRTRRKYAHMAIHPYPQDLVREVTLRGGEQVVIRPIRPEDARIEETFVNSLSSESKYFRFMEVLKRLTPQMLVRFTQIDYDREMAFIATVEDGAGGGGEIEVGVARYGIEADGRSCEFAIVVADEWHDRGLGSRLMKALMAEAKARGLREMYGEVLAANSSMLGLARRLGFKSRTHEDDPDLRVVTRKL